MKKEDFWNLIDETNQLCPTHDQESIMAVATDKLLKLSVKDILDFHMIQQEYLGAAYRNDLHAASEAMGATPSYDGLQAFIYWLISRGKEVFINAVNDPDTLADVPKAGEKIEFRSFGFAAYTAYSMKMDRIDPENMSDIYSALNSLDYHKPVVIQDEVLGELKLDKDYNTFEGEIQWCGTDVYLSLEVNAESKPSWTRARSAAKKLLADCETWDKAMRELAAKNLTGLANDWLSQDEENPRDPETDPITEEELARRISMTSLSVTSGGSFTAWFDCDEMFTDHAVTVYGSLKKGLKTANIEG